MSPSVIPPAIDDLLAWAGGLDRAQVEAALAVDPPPTSAERKAALARQDTLGVSAAVLSVFDSRGRPHYKRLKESGAFDEARLRVRFWDHVGRGVQAIMQRHKLTSEEFEIIVAPVRAAGYDFDTAPAD